MSLLSRIVRNPFTLAVWGVVCVLGGAVGVVLTKPLRALGYLYIMRIAVLVAVALMAMPLLSWLGPLRSLTVGAYEVTHWLQALVATVVFALASGSVYAIVAAFAHGMGKRYPGHIFDLSPLALRWWRLFVVLSILGNTVWMIAASWESVSNPFSGQEVAVERQGSLAGLVGGVCGAALIVLLVGGATWLDARFFAKFKKRVAGLGMGLGGVYDWLANGGLVGALERWIGLHRGKVKRSTPLARLYHHLGAKVGQGVVRVDPKGNLVLEHGQARIHAYALLTTVVYIILVLNTPLVESVAPVSAVFMLLVVAAYVGFGLTYLLDHYRVPLLMFVVAYCGFMTQWRESDHFYPVLPGSSIPTELTVNSTRPVYPELEAPLGRWAAHETVEVPLGENVYQTSNAKPLGLPAQLLGLDGREKKTVVVIALAGGGIQAAAWPLAALEKISEDIPHFHKHVRLISGVSGGSVGALYYAHAYDFQKDNELLVKQAKLAAEESSLGRITHAILSDDLGKIAFPFMAGERGGRVLKDRGMALEETLNLHATRHFPPVSDSAPLLEKAMLSGWGRDAMNRSKPALIFNGTVVETGERISFSTVPRNNTERSGTVEFSRRYHADLSMSTAARLSATFPVVSPAARPATKDLQQNRVDVVPGRKHWEVFPNGCSYLHVVDGGYFEVSGVVGALAWLGEAMEQLEDIESYRAGEVPASAFFSMPERIIFIQMSGFPEAPANACVDEGGNTAGTLFDAISPVVAAIGIRNGVQASFPNDLIKLFKKRWMVDSKRAVDFRHIVLKPAIEQAEWEKRPWTNSGFLPQSPPLSWHLRLCEKEEMEVQLKKGPAADALKEEIAKLVDLLPKQP